jgi:ketosteroid isomerase-like protein
MKRVLVIAVLVIAAFSLAFGQTKDKSNRQRGNAEQALIQIEREWSEAVVKHDVAFFERLYADEYAYTDSFGRVLNRTQDIAEIKSGDVQFESVIPDEMTAHVYGDAAVVTGRSTIKGQLKGKDISGQIRWTDTFVWRNGRWQCVATQGTRIAQQ